MMNEYAHVVQCKRKITSFVNCPLTADIRLENSDMNFSNICHFFLNSDKVRVCKICARSMRKFSIS